MPELPEVETVVRDLRPLVVGRTLQKLHLGRAKLRRAWNKSWTKAVLGNRTSAIHRRAKWIILELETKGSLLVHLGMTGQFTVNAAKEERPDHTHLVFELDDGNELRFRDVRRFGSFDYFADPLELRAFLDERLGPEPNELIPKDFAEAVRGSKRPLKAILLDQKIAAGVGNIYADESLFRSGLHPETRGHEMKVNDCDRLRMAIAEVISLAIEKRGSTIRDYIGGSGLKGGFQDEFAVYGRTGEACPSCETVIEMLRVGGRSSHFCPKCQKK